MANECKNQEWIIGTSTSPFNPSACHGRLIFATGMCSDTFAKSMVINCTNTPCDITVKPKNNVWTFILFTSYINSLIYHAHNLLKIRLRQKYYIFTSPGVQWGKRLTHDWLNWIVKLSVQSVSMATTVRVHSIVLCRYVLLMWTSILYVLRDCVRCYQLHQCTK